MNKIIALIIFLLLLVACSSKNIYHHELPSVLITAKRVDLNDTTKVTHILNQQFLSWRNVKYRLGGLSRSGIDCSGLVYKTYREKLGIDVPRTTEYQSKTGKKISKRQLKSGDLIFFKTGIMTRHVGIYINQGNFLHVSSSKGVKISNLKNPYWSSVYWQSRRL